MRAVSTLMNAQIVVSKTADPFRGARIERKDKKRVSNQLGTAVQKVADHEQRQSRNDDS